MAAPARATCEMRKHPSSVSPLSRRILRRYNAQHRAPRQRFRATTIHASYIGQNKLGGVDPRGSAIWALYGSLPHMENGAHLKLTLGSNPRPSCLARITTRRTSPLRPGKEARLTKRTRMPCMVWTKARRYHKPTNGTKIATCGLNYTNLVLKTRYFKRYIPLCRRSTLHSESHGFVQELLGRAQTLTQTRAERNPLFRRSMARVLYYLASL